MKMEEVKVGMTVRLNSGGTLMVVAEVCEVVKCITVAWHDGHRIERHTLSPEMVYPSGRLELDCASPGERSCLGIIDPL